MNLLSAFEENEFFSLHAFACSEKFLLCGNYFLSIDIMQTKIVAKGVVQVVDGSKQEMAPQQHCVNNNKTGSTFFGQQTH